MRGLVLEIKYGEAAILLENGEINRIKDRGFEVGETVDAPEETKVFRFPKALTRAVAAAAVVVVVALCGGNYYYTSVQAAAFVRVSGDVSLEYVLNRKDKVIAVNGLDDAGKALAAELEHAGYRNHSLSEVLDMSQSSNTGAAVTRSTTVISVDSEDKDIQARLEAEVSLWLENGESVYTEDTDFIVYEDEAAAFEESAAAPEAPAATPAAESAPEAQKPSEKPEKEDGASKPAKEDGTQKPAADKKPEKPASETEEAAEAPVKDTEAGEAEDHSVKEETEETDESALLDGDAAAEDGTGTSEDPENTPSAEPEPGEQGTTVPAEEITDTPEEDPSAPTETPTETPAETPSGEPEAEDPAVNPVLSPEAPEEEGTIYDPAAETQEQLFDAEEDEEAGTDEALLCKEEAAEEALPEAGDSAEAEAAAPETADIITE